MTTRHLLVAFDFSEPSRRALEMARDLAARLKSAVDVLYVHEDPFADIPGTSPESLWATAEEMKAHEKSIELQVQLAVDEVFGPDASTVTVTVERGVVVPHVITKAQERGCDLVLTGTTGKGGVARALLGSVSQKLLQKSPVPVMLVP